MITQLKNALEKLRTAKPLVLNLTNYVTMDFMANSLLALGAAPVMSVGDDELEELIQIASSININIGTLDEAFSKRCHQAALLAKQYKKPVVLDPVGAGATLIRTKLSRDLLEYADIVRGNASEIMSLQENSNKTLGVESVNSTFEAKNNAKQLAAQYQCTVVVSGAEDFITNGQTDVELTFGSALMKFVTGMGCTLTAVIAAFRGIEVDSFESAKMGTSYFGLCGQLAAGKTKHSGSFRTAFIDAIHEANFVKIQKLYQEMHYDGATS